VVDCVTRKGRAMKSWRCRKRAGLLVLLSVLLASFLVIGCGGDEETTTTSEESGATETTTETEATDAEQFPVKDITWIVPYSPGGGFDTYSRGVAQVMSKKLGVNILVKNVEGGGGVTGTTNIYKADPDGYTIGIIFTPPAVQAQVLRDAPFDVRKFTYIGKIQNGVYSLPVAADSPYESIEDFQQAFSSDNPIRVAATSKVNGAYASLRMLTPMDIPFTMVAGYKGSSEGLTGIIRGDAETSVNFSVASVKPFVDAGDLRVLVQFQKERSPLLPDVPTAAELGYPEEYQYSGFERVVVASPGIPDDVAQVLRDAFQQTMEDSEFLKWAEEAERPLSPSTAEEIRQTVEDEIVTTEQYKDRLMEYVE